MMTSLRACLSFALLLLPTLAPAATHTVEQDGSGDFSTIADAIAFAANGDEILVGPGTWSEQLLIQKILFIRGTGATVLSGAGSFRCIEYRIGGGGSLEDLRFVDGNAASGGNGGAVLMNDVDLDILRCEFEGNEAWFQGGALSIGRSFVDIEDCVFLSNYAGHTGGAVLGVQEATLHFKRCTFVENDCPVQAGAISSSLESSLSVSDCLFLRNTSDEIAGAIYSYSSTYWIEGNTFVDNHSQIRATVVLHLGKGSLYRNIFAGETTGFALQFLFSDFSHGCNLFWDNEDGPISGDELAPDEIQADPLFCAPGQDGFHLYDISPAAPVNSPCGQLIGALPVACSTTGVEESSWSRVKSLY